MSIRELGDQTRLTHAEVARLSELISEWQMLADLSFADLVLWAPHEVSGFVAIAQVRPMTSATVFTQDLVGTRVSIKERPLLQEVLETGAMIRDQDP
jgi:hypothetical protein